jgi:hypothetical protein
VNSDRLPPNRPFDSSSQRGTVIDDQQGFGWEEVADVIETGVCNMTGRIHHHQADVIARRSGRQLLDRSTRLALTCGELLLCSSAIDLRSDLSAGICRGHACEHRTVNQPN